MQAVREFESHPFRHYSSHKRDLREFRRIRPHNGAYLLLGLRTVAESTLGHHQKPCALLNINGYYDRLAGFLDHMVDEAFVKAPHREMLIVEQDIDALLKAIDGYEAPQVGKWIGRQET